MIHVPVTDDVKPLRAVVSPDISKWVIAFCSLCSPDLTVVLPSVLTCVLISAESETLALWPTLTQEKQPPQKGCFITRAIREL